MVVLNVSAIELILINFRMSFFSPAVVFVTVFFFTQNYAKLKRGQTPVVAVAAAVL